MNKEKSNKNLLLTDSLHKTRKGLGAVIEESKKVREVIGKEMEDYLKSKTLDTS